MEGVTKIEGREPGKIVAIFAGVHGNERVGLDAFAKILPDLQLIRGTAYFVTANPPAIAKNVRLIDKNLNRCFRRDLTGNSYEEERARELMDLMDTCDALIDIHSSNSRETTPFAICDDASLPLAHKMRFSIVSTGWDELEPGGSEGYMRSIGKFGLGLECGSVHEPEKNLALAERSILQFLRHFGLLAEDAVEYDNLPQRHIEAYKVAHKQSDTLSFIKEFRDFEPLTAGEIFARDGATEYVASEGDCIIFARPNTKIGAEAFILGREIT